MTPEYDRTSRLARPTPPDDCMLHASTSKMLGRMLDARHGRGQCYKPPSARRVHARDVEFDPVKRRRDIEIGLPGEHPIDQVCVRDDLVGPESRACYDLEYRSVIDHQHLVPLRTGQRHDLV